MSGNDDYNEAQNLKKKLKKWETDFVNEHKRKPKKEDIDAAPQDVQETYKSYNKLKRQIQERIDEKTNKFEKEEHDKKGKGTVETSDVIDDHGKNKNNEEEEKNEKESTKSISTTHDTSLEGETEVWGRQFDRKKSGECSVNGDKSTEKKANQYLQKLSSKLFDVSKKIGNAKPTYRRSKPLIIPRGSSKDEEEKSDIYDYSSTDQNSEFKIKNEMFEKAASLASKKSLPTEIDSEEVIIPDRFKVKSKPKLSSFSSSFCENDYGENNSAESGKSKIGLSKDNNWDEIDHMAPFIDESHKINSENSVESELTHVKSRAKPFSSSSDNEKDQRSPETEDPMEIDCETDKSVVSRKRRPVIKKSDQRQKRAVEDVVKEADENNTKSKYDFDENDDVPILPKHGKRKAEDSKDRPTKKRKIKVIEDRDMEENGIKEQEEDDLPKTKKTYAPARSKASSSAASSENFVKLNMKIKTYKRKGRQGKTGPQMKRFLWKQKMKARSQSYGNKCFKCGQEGHWANKCQGGGKAKEEIEDQPPVLEENFPTLKQATMMAKGIKIERKKKEPKTSTKDLDSNDQGQVEDREDEDEDDIDELDIEAQVVRTKREVQEAPPPMEPFFSIEEKDPTDLPDSVKKGLKKFGYEKFRHGQEKAVLRILSGSSTLVILSTGGGKSLTYQLPAVLYAEKSTCFTLVISPLVSLMEDQITGLPPGVKGACLHTNMTKAQREHVMESVKEGKVHFLLVSPEAIAGGAMSFLNSASSLPPISFVCIDEAHCLSEWSHNFRPSYLRLTKVLREKFGVQCFLGLTATATQSTAADVAKHLGIDNLDEAVVRGPPVPKNLFLSVSRDENREEALIGILQGDRFFKCESIIIYCTRRETTERLATLIRTSLQDAKGENWTGDRTKRKGGKKQYNYWDAESYHAGLTAAARKRVQNAFMSGRLRVVVATVAFGMGLDKSNVRGVIHYNMPKSFESYVQEIGRAGRDGMPSHCHVFLEAEGKDLSELRRHTYSNTVDYRTLKKFVQRVFTPCRCIEVHKRHKEAVQDSNSELSEKEMKELFDDWEECPVAAKRRLCHGHERAIPIETFVLDLDVKEEGIATLFCYLELHPTEAWKVENMTNVYSTCNIQCYGGPALLQETAKKCPPVAVAIAKAKKDGKNFADKTSFDFPVVEISDTMGWDSGPVKRELKMLMWNMNGTNGPRRTGVVVEFTDLAFHYRAPGDLSEEEIDDVIMSLHERIQRQEKTELSNLRYLSNTLHGVSHKNFWMCADDLDEKKNAKLKAILEDYFQEQKDFKAAVLEEKEPELSSQELSQVRSDIRQFINLYSQEHKLNGRAIARVFHGIASPCFPATTWGRVRRFWRSNIDVDFNAIIKLATRELVQMR